MQQYKYVVKYKANVLNSRKEWKSIYDTYSINSHGIPQNQVLKQGTHESQSNQRWFNYKSKEHIPLLGMLQTT